VRHASGKVGIEALLQVTVHKVEYKVQLGRLRDDLAQSDDVFVEQVLEQRHLAQRRHGHALVVRVQPHPLERHDAIVVSARRAGDDG